MKDQGSAPRVFSKLHWINDWSPQLTLLLCVSVAALAMMSMLALRSLSVLREGNAWLVHTEQVRLEISQVLQLLTDVETAGRGFALTHDEQYLAPYQAALPALPGRLARLRELTADNSSQRAMTERLAQLANQRVQRIEEVISRARSPALGSASASVGSGVGRTIMDAARAVASQMQAAEDRLWQQRVHAYQRAERNAIIAQVSTSLLSVLLLGLIAFSTLRYVASKRRDDQILATTLKSVGDAVIATDPRGAVSFMNEVASQLTGWSEEAARGRPLHEVFNIVNEDTRQTVESPVDKVLREGKIVGLANHTALIARDGSELPIEDSAAPILANGELAGVVLVFRDAAAARSSQRLLLERERQFVALTNAMPQIVWTEGPDGKHEYFNRGWYAYTGLTERESLDADAWSRVLHPEDAQRSSSRWVRSRETGMPYEVECRLRRHDGAYRWFLVRALSDTNAQGDVLRWFGTCTDIDSAKRTEESLRATEAALRETDIRKDVFLATLSHELRNPLAPIRNAAALLGKDGLDPGAAERSRQIIVRQVHHMASLLDDLLDVSRITRGVFVLKKQYVQLQSLLSEAVLTVRPMVEAKRHRLLMQWPEQPLYIEADPVRVVPIATNLLANAVKYTDPEGEIAIGASAQGEGVLLTVRDNGIGLARDMLTKVFDMFSQVEPDQERNEGGLGIGLALVKGLVDLHGGHVEAVSAGLGSGSEFRVFLPGLRASAQPDSNGAATVSRADQPAARRVLIADDNRDGAETLAMLLNSNGHTVYVTHSGSEALQMVAEQRPQVAVLDIGMPDLDGYEVAKRIRSEAWGQGMLLIAVTGWGQEHDKQRALSVGFDHHLTKPFDADVLGNLISGALH